MVGGLCAYVMVVSGPGDGLRRFVDGLRTLRDVDLVHFLPAPSDDRRTAQRSEAAAE